MTLGKVSVTARQQRKAPFQPLHQYVWREVLHPYRRKLERQGQAVKLAADVDHDMRVVVGQDEVFPYMPGPCDEKLHRSYVARILGRDTISARERWERLNRQLPLAMQPQWRAARREHRQSRAAGQEVRDDLWGGGKDMFEMSITRRTRLFPRKRRNDAWSVSPKFWRTPRAWAVAFATCDASETDARATT